MARSGADVSMHRGACCPAPYRNRGSARHIGDSTDVEDAAIRAGPAKQPLVKQGGEWCPLPAQRDISRAEVGDRRDTGARGDQGGIADLQRERVFGIRLVSQCLPMAANRSDRGCINTRDFQQCIGRVAKTLPRPGMQLADLIDAAGIRLGNSTHKSRTQRLGIGMLMGLQNVQRS
jgi:hypothetical protein